MTVIVYEPFVHFIPTGLGWVKGMESLGHTVYQLPAFQYRISEIDAEVDVLIAHDVSAQVAEDIIVYKKAFPKTKIAILTCTYEPHYDKLKEYVDLWFNLSIQNMYLAQKFGSNGMRFANVQLAAHPEFSYPIDVVKEYDVSFFGQIGAQGHGYRDEDKYLFPVIKKGYKGIFGGFAPYPAAPYPKLNEFYNKTKVNLNFHYNNQKVESPTDPLSRIELNGRVFELALSGNFQLCDHPMVEVYFNGSVPYVTPDKWLDRIDYYLTHDKEAKLLAQAARCTALAKHTYKNRAEQILQALGYE